MRADQADAGAGAAGRTLAAIDIGTNSLHLLVARTTGEDQFETVTRDKEMVRLGSGSGDMKVLGDGAMDRGVEALRRFRQAADSAGAEVRAVATSAVREAENRDVFLQRARDEAGVHVEVISGVEEARLIHLGVVQAVPVFDRRVLLIDIGGGSTELLVGRSTEVLSARSLKLGAIRLTDRFFPEEPVRRRHVEQCRQHVRSYLAPAVSEVRRHGFDVAVGSSGTIQNLAEMVQARRGEAPGRSVSNVTFSREELAEVVKTLVKADTVQSRLKVPGLDSKRVDIILAGALLMEEACGALGVEEVVVSDYALREGVVLDALRRHHQASMHRLGDLRYQSVVHLASIFPGERAHTEHTAVLALALLDACAGLHRLPETAPEYLEAAALLANVGLFISHDRHHLHSYYVIRNSERLSGFTDHEIEVVALVARYHRKSAPKPKHEAFARLGPADQDLVRVLAGILRIAIALDRTRAGVVRSLTGRQSGRNLTVELETGDADASLEVYTANERRTLLESALEVEVSFVLDAPAPAPSAA